MENPSTAGEVNVPFFVFPSSVEFFTDDKGSHKQIVTLYNPYHFAIHYKVHCTFTKKYEVLESEGSINASCSTDIIIRHRDVCFQNEGKRDLFRFNIYERGKSTLIGYKDVPATLYGHRTAPHDNEVDKTSSHTLPVQLSRTRANQPQNQQVAVQQPEPRNLSVVILTVIILAGLMACYVQPESDGSTVLTKYITLTVTAKICIGYIMGACTIMVVIILNPGH